jgi:hypothetical protein
MEQQNKYFTPDISELHVGYEYYTEWKDGTLRKIIIDEYIDRNGDGDLPQAFWGLSNGICGGSSVHPVMTKYLDREDIESLGWVFTEKSVDATFYTLNTGDKQKDTIENRWRLRTEKGTRIWITQGYDWRRFLGECKSVNELRMLMKMLKIQ